MAQTSYTDKPAIGFPGMLSDISFKRVSTGINKQGSALPFGLAVKKGTNEGEYVLPTALVDVVVGIVLHSHDVNLIALAGAAAAAGVPVDDKFNVLEEGCCYVKVEETVVQGDPVFVRYASGAGGTQLGSFRKSADTTTAGPVKGAKYRTGASAGGIAEVEFSKLVNAS